MKSKWKRNAVVATMAILVCAAVALNWKYAGTFDEFPADGAPSGTKLLGEATLVSNPDKTEDSAQVSAATDSAQVAAAPDSESVAAAQADASGIADAAAYSGADYFASARLTRQQARDNAVSLLQEAAQRPDASEAAQNEASEGIQVLANYTMKEAQIENLVTAKGYQDCVAFMGDGSVSVVVSTGDEALQAEDVARIADIAMSETGFPASGVKIMSAN